MKILHLRNIDPSGVTNIIFDWGGVITPIDFQLTFDAFKKLGYTSFVKQKGNYPHSDLLMGFEVGKIRTRELLEAFRKEVNPGTSENQIWEAWNKVLLDTPSANIKTLKKLGDRYSISILSNTNEVHVDYYKKVLDKKFNLDFFQLFDHVFLSYKLGMRKPGREIFDKAIEISGVDPAKTLYIDDLEANCLTADCCGFITLHLAEMVPFNVLFEKWIS